MTTKEKLAKAALRTIDQDLLACRQTLQCAAEALGNAEDQRFRGEHPGELAAAAVRVVERCVEELSRIEQAVDRLSVNMVRP
jgi:hypothetical protein